MTTGLFTPNRNPAASYSNRVRQKPSRALYFRTRRAAKPKKLTKRDHVAELLAEDLSVADIASALGLTAKAVERHLYAIRKRLGPQAV